MTAHKPTRHSYVDINSIKTLKRIVFPKLNEGNTIKIGPPNFCIGGIPKQIHQTFYTKDLPSELKNNVEKLKRLNAGWEYKLYDDSDITDFIKKHYEPHVLEKFQRIDQKYGAARADLFRYLLIYKLGGFYLDIKASMDVPLDTVLRPDDEYILAQWNNNGQFKQWGTHYDLPHVEGGEFQQWHIGAAPGHPFLKATIENVLANIEKYNPSLHGIGKTGVIKVTGPVAYTASIAPLMPLYPHRLVKDHKELGLSYSIYNNESDLQVNEIHKKSFNSHYSLQTNPIIKLSIRKHAFAVFTSFLNVIHGLMQKRAQKI